MRIKKGTPGRGGLPRRDTFSYTPVGSGLKASFTAFVAGEPYWADEAHEHTDEDRGTKPCLNWMTDGAVRCARCRKRRPVKCIGWVPLYREVDGQPVLVIVHESASDNVLSLKYPMCVLVGRVDPKSSVFVRRSETQLRFTTEQEHRRSPVDITGDLLDMWNLPELNDWLMKQPRAAEVPTGTPPVLRQRLSVPPPTTDTERLALDANRINPTAWDQAVQESVQRAAERKAHAERNGVHKPDATE